MMLKSFKSLLISSVALAALSTSVQAETLDEALGLAYQNNPTLLAARAALRATDENVAIALSGWRPSLSLNGNVARTRSETNIISGASSGAVFGSGTTLRTQETVAAQFRQPLFRGLKTTAGTDQAKAQVMAQRARLQSSEAQVLFDAAQAYLDVLRDQAVVELQRNNVQVLTRQFEATTDRFNVGEITKTDVAQAQARLEGSKASLIQAESDLARSRASYENSVGKAPEALVSPTAAKGLPISVEEAVDASIKANPAYLAADFTAQAAQNGIDVSRGDLLPSADLEANYQKGWDTVANKSTAITAQARAVLTVPIYQQGAEYARLRQAKHTAGQRRLEADQARLDARENATAAYKAYEAATASIVSLKSQIEASKIALEGVQREAEVGSRTVLDVLDAEQELLNARVNLVRAERTQVVASYQLLSTTGRLTAESIGLKVAMYDPTTHYNDVRYQAFGSSTAADDDAKKAK